MDIVGCMVVATLLGIWFGLLLALAQLKSKNLTLKKELKVADEEAKPTPGGEPPAEGQKAESGK